MTQSLNESMTQSCLWIWHRLNVPGIIAPLVADVLAVTRLICDAPISVLSKNLTPIQFV